MCCRFVVVAVNVIVVVILLVFKTCNEIFVLLRLLSFSFSWLTREGVTASLREQPVACQRTESEHIHNLPNHNHRYITVVTDFYSSLSKLASWDSDM